MFKKRTVAVSVIGAVSLNLVALTSAYSDTPIPPIQNAAVSSVAISSSSNETESAEGKKNRGPVIKFLSPLPDTIMDIPAVSVVIQFPTGAEPELRLNGSIVDDALVGRTEEDPKSGLTTQYWYGIGLADGANRLTARAMLKNILGQEIALKLMVRGAPKKMVLRALRTRIPADGKSAVVIQGQLLDEHGNRSNRDAVISLNVSEGVLTGEDIDEDTPGLQLQATQGQFHATLRSGIKSGIARIRAVSNGLEAFTQVQFETALRPSLLSGVFDIRVGSRGTNLSNGFGTIRPDEVDGTDFKFHSAMFATGPIGKWLFTGAYNTTNNINQRGNGASSVYRDYQPNEQQYPLFGDSSSFVRLAESQDKFYARIERNQDFAQWGDFNTTEFSEKTQQISGSTRQLHGFKMGFLGGRTQLTGFYGNNPEGFQRDLIVPDGTSGYYFFSHRLLIIGTENVTIESEKFNSPGSIVDVQPMQRGIDYEIDYDRGTLLFRHPLLRTDVDKYGDVLIHHIIITYQYESRDGSSNAYGTRLKYSFSRGQDKEGWLGGTFVRTNQGSRKFELFGADALLPIRGGSLTAELAHSKGDTEFYGATSGSAYRLELEKNSAKLKTHAYYRATDAGFSNDATTSFIPGQKRYGLTINSPLSPSTDLRLQYDHESNRGITPRQLDSLSDLLNPGSSSVPGAQTDNVFQSFTAGLHQSIGRSHLGFDWVMRNRTDNLNPALIGGNSNQLETKFDTPLGKKLTFQVLNSTSLSKGTDAIFPDRTALGIGWDATPGVKLRLSQTFYSTGNYAGKGITSLETNGTYKPGANTELLSRFAVLGSQGGLSGEGSVGLNHFWVLSRGFKMNLNYEHVMGSLLGRTSAGNSFAQPFGVGQSSAGAGANGGTSYGVAFEYNRSSDFKAGARYENRLANDGRNTVITFAANGKLTRSLSSLLRFQQASSANQTLGGLGDSAIMRLGIAYRDPLRDNFNALMRYDYRKNINVLPDSLLTSSGTGGEDHTVAVEMAYAPSWKWEFYNKWAVRHSFTRLASDYNSVGTIALVQGRAVYRMNYKMDVAVEGRWLDQRTAGFSAAGFSLEGGYWMTPDFRLAAGYGFGKADDKDFYGARSNGGLFFGISAKISDLFGFGRQYGETSRSLERKANDKEYLAKLAKLSSDRAKLIKDSQKAIPAVASAPQSGAQSTSRGNAEKISEQNSEQNGESAQTAPTGKSESVVAKSAKTKTKRTLKTSVKSENSVPVPQTTSSIVVPDAWKEYVPENWTEDELHAFERGRSASLILSSQLSEAKASANSNSNSILFKCFSPSESEADKIFEMEGMLASGQTAVIVSEGLKLEIMAKWIQIARRLAN